MKKNGWEGEVRGRHGCRAPWAGSQAARGFPEEASPPWGLTATAGRVADVELRRTRRSSQPPGCTEPGPEGAGVGGLRPRVSGTASSLLINSRCPPRTTPTTHRSRGRAEARRRKEKILCSANLSGQEQEGAQGGWRGPCRCLPALPRCYGRSSWRSPC